MPRKLLATMTLDTLEDEVLYTGAALRADPIAQAFAERTDDWLARIDEVRATDRKARTAVANTDAARRVAGDRLNQSSTAFGDDLYMAVRKDRESARWLQFFPKPVSHFVRQARALQVQVVRGWLSSEDAVLERHRPELERWSQAADKALVDTRAVPIVRGEARQGREKLAADLTLERDTLRDELATLAREQGLPRDWPDIFFRVETRKPGEETGAGSGDTPDVPAKD